LRELGDDHLRFFRELLAQVQEKREDGAFRVPDEEVKDLLAMMLLAALAGGDDAALSPGEEAILLDFGLRAGLQGDEDAAAVQQAIAAYLAQRPFDPRLAQAAEQAARGLASEAGSARVGQAFVDFMGKAKKMEALEQSERPAGTIPAGPAARFQLNVPTKGKPAKKKPKSKRRR